MSMQARSILVTEIDKVALGDVEVPEPGPGEILVESLFTCVSPGTELRCLAGGQAGSENRPFIPGYANVGRVIARGEGVEMAEGAVVLSGGTRKAECARLWGGHISHAVTAASGVVPVPEAVSPSGASAAILAAIAYHGVRLSNPRPDERVACVGLGPIGLCSALLHATTGAQVAGFDLYAERVGRARSLGLHAHQVRGSLVEAAQAVFPDGADVVVDATGAAAVLREAVKIGREPPWGPTLRDLPRLVVQGSYAGDVSFDYHEAFFRAYHIVIPRNHTAFDDRAVLELMRRGKLDGDKLVGAALAPSEAPKAYRTLRERPQQWLTVAFDWSKRA
jgi:2-desacetyl-2-hydroxyethyl bacteriochlorophyllide A dehydrogenase